MWPWVADCTDCFPAVSRLSSGLICPTIRTLFAVTAMCLCCIWFLKIKIMLVPLCSHYSTLAKSCQQSNELLRCWMILLSVIIVARNLVIRLRSDIPLKTFQNERRFQLSFCFNSSFHSCVCNQEGINYKVSERSEYGYTFSSKIRFAKCAWTSNRTLASPR